MHGRCARVDADRLGRPPELLRSPGDAVRMEEGDGVLRPGDFASRFRIFHLACRFPSYHRVSRLLQEPHHDDQGSNSHPIVRSYVLKCLININATKCLMLSMRGREMQTPKQFCRTTRTWKRYADRFRYNAVTFWLHLERH